jgi:hypothetical protein
VRGSTKDWTDRVVYALFTRRGSHDLSCQCLVSPTRFTMTSVPKPLSAQQTKTCSGNPSLDFEGMNSFIGQSKTLRRCRQISRIYNNVNARFVNRHGRSLSLYGDEIFLPFFNDVLRVSCFKPSTSRSCRDVIFFWLIPQCPYN